MTLEQFYLFVIAISVVAAIFGTTIYLWERKKLQKSLR